MSTYEIVWTIVGSILAIPFMTLLCMAIYATWTGIPVEIEIDLPWMDKALVIRTKGFK